MAVVIENRQFYCTTSDINFGPTFASDMQGEDFMNDLENDPRLYSEGELNKLYFTKYINDEVKPFHNHDLNVDMNGCDLVEATVESVDYDSASFDLYSIDINDEPYWYHNRDERNLDLKLMRELFPNFKYI